jgi:replication factor A1
MSEIQEIYDHLLKSGFSEEELKEEIEEKEREFHGFITKQGALFLIAKENGIEVLSPDIDQEVYEEIGQEIDYNEFLIDIAEIRENMTNLVLLGKIVDLFPLKEFVRKDGTSGIVGSFLLADATGIIKIVLWNDPSKIMKSDFFSKGKIVQIINGYSKVGTNERIEVHVSKKSKIILEPESIPKNIMFQLRHINIENLDLSEYQYQHKNKNNIILKIKDLLKMDGFIESVAGFINNYELKEFKKDNGEISFLLKFELTDDTGLIRVNIWDMKAIDILKIIEKGMAVKLHNVFIKENNYSNQREIQFTKKSILEIL